MAIPDNRFIDCNFQPVSSRGLNTSQKLDTYIPTLSTSSFKSGFKQCLFSGATSSLDAFSFYSRMTWLLGNCPVGQPIN